MASMKPLPQTGEPITVTGPVKHMPASMFPDRPWGPGNNPKTAVHAWLPAHPEFEIDRSVEDRLLVTSAPDGFLRRTRA